MIEEKAKLFRTLSDPNRLRILKMLQIRPLCVCEITEVLQLATSTVSKHLSILKQTSFIIEQKDGKWVNYLLNPQPEDPRISSIISTLDFWIADQKIVAADRAKVTKVDRFAVCSR